MAGAAVKAGKKRPVGRPRADGRPPITRQQILLAAATEFSANGFSGTSVRMIAERLGIHAPTIFQHFKSKDALLVELYTEMMEYVLAIYTDLDNQGGTGAVKLYRLIYVDVFTVARGQLEVKAVVGLPELRQSKFKHLMAMRKQAVLAYERTVRGGIADGSLRKTNVRMTAENLFMLAETSVYSPYPDKLGTPRKQARETADFALMSLLAKRTSIDKVRKAATPVKLPAMPAVMV